MELIRKMNIKEIFRRARTLKCATVVACISIFSSCIEDLGVFKGIEPTLVVDGSITNLPGPHTFKLLITHEFNTGPDYSLVEGATIKIVDDIGNEVDLTDERKGVYETPETFSGVAGRSYQMVITLNSGKKYTSSFEKLNEVPPIDNISYSIEEVEELSGNNTIVDIEKVLIKVDFCDPENEKNYYRWRYQETFQVLAPLAGGTTGGGGNFRGCGRTLPKADCWAKGFDHEFLKVSNDLLFDGSELKDYTIFATDIDRKFDIGYSALVVQYSLSKEAYEYWEAIKNQIGNNGTIFETSNYQIRGNLSAVDDPDELVLGYFGASAVSSNRLFMDDADIQYNHQYSCEPNQIGCFPAACIDCREYLPSSSDIKPDFWPL